MKIFDTFGCFWFELWVFPLCFVVAMFKMGVFLFDCEDSDVGECLLTFILMNLFVDVIRR